MENLCDRVSIIRQGQIVETGTLDQLRHLTRSTINVETKKSATRLEELSGTHDISQNGFKYRFSIDSNALNDVMKVLLSAGINSMTVEPPSLEELFMRHYGDDIRKKEEN